MQREKHIKDIRIDSFSSDHHYAADAMINATLNNKVNLLSNNFKYGNSYHD